MSFKDYSATPALNTTAGDDIFIGPDMPRNNVRPALQQMAADGRELYDLFAGISLAGVQFRETIAEGIADFAVGEQFMSNETGELRFYKRIVAVPYYEDLGGIGSIPYEQREVLNSNRTYYVRTNGSDSNTGLANTAGGAFLTIQKAIDTAYKTLDLNGYTVTIRVADGTYTGLISIIGPLVGATAVPPLSIIGNETTPANVLISTAGNALTLNCGAYAFIAGMKFQTTSGFGWRVIDRSNLDHQNCAFGNVAEDMMIALGMARITGTDETTLTVSGNAKSFCHATVRSRVSFGGQTINFATACAFSEHLWGINDSTIALDDAIISGTRPSGDTAVHDLAFLNTYNLVNADGWGYAGTGQVFIEDGGFIAATGFVNRTFYVRSDATSDTNDGLENTVGRAFKTIQGCLNFIADLPNNPAAYDLSSGVNIMVANGTYASFRLRDVHYVDAAITGNTGSPSSVVINSATDCILALGLNTKWTVKGLKLVAAGGNGIRAEQGSKVNYESMDFGSCSGAHISGSGGCIIEATGNYTISGGAAMHVQALYASTVNVMGVTVTLTGTPAFSSAFARSWNNSNTRFTATFSGAATGVRCDVRYCGVVDINGAGGTYLPGNGGNVAQTGGQYL